MTDVATHTEGCWAWGQKHHACAVREIERLRARVAELDAPKKTDPDLFQIVVRLAAGHADASDAWALLEEVERLRKRVAEIEGGDQ